MNTRDDIKRYLSSLTDEELIANQEEAKKDIEIAAETEANSDWHQSCFAGWYLLSEECVRRGLRAKS